MKQAIHPDYVEATFKCSCGAVFVTRSTKPDVHLELCSQCHPFYTGKQKFVDTGGRVQRFEDKFGGAAASVMERRSAEKEARRKSAEEAAIAAKAERDAKAAAKAEKAAKYETASAVESGDAAADVIEAAAEEAPADEAPAETSGATAEETAE